jgi:hypothetical protein
MPRWSPCPSCGTVAQSCGPCPHCGTELRCDRPGLSSATAGLLGLIAVAGCHVNENADYGSGETDLTEESTEDPVDEDKDGYEVGDDCDDNDETIHPGAAETPGDEIDSNCDGEDDT